MHNVKFLTRPFFIGGFILTMMFQPLFAQSELSAEIELYGGNEYNIFKSPDVLLDRETFEPMPIDSIIHTDMYAEVGYDIDFVTAKTGKSVTEIGSDLWYRNYIRFTELNQSRMKTYANYQRFISDQVVLGGEYDFIWSNRIGTSVTGDLLMRSFKYFGHTGQVFAEFMPSKRFNTTTFVEYEYKNYYDERTSRPLDHGNLEFNVDMEFEFVRDNEIALEIYGLDRNYYAYPSLDSTGDFDLTNPHRHFRYYGAKFDYNWTPVRGLRINPGVEVKRRTDEYQGYYSYKSFGADLRLRYMTGNFYISLYGDYQQMEYDIRPAFTSIEMDPMLVYDFFDYQFKVRYAISDQWELEFIFESDNRSSNTDLEYFKTRRPYHNRQIMIGITYSLQEMKW